MIEPWYEDEHLHVIAARRDGFHYVMEIATGDELTAFGVTRDERGAKSFIGL